MPTNMTPAAYAVAELNESGKRWVNVSEKNEMDFHPFFNPMKMSHFPNGWTNLNLRCAHIPKAVSPSRVAGSGHVMLPRKRGFEYSANEGGMEQTFEAKRRNVFGGLTVTETNPNGFGYEGFPSVDSFFYENERSVANKRISTTTENGELRGRFFRSAQPIFQTRTPPPHALPEMEDPSRRFARTTSPSRCTGSYAAKENIAFLFDANTIHRSTHSNLLVNPNNVGSKVNPKSFSLEYSDRLNDSSSPFAATVELSSTSQSSRRSCGKIKSPLDGDLNSGAPVSSLPAPILSIQNSVASTGGAFSDRYDGISCPENLDQHLKLPQNKASLRNGQICDRAWSAGTSPRTKTTVDQRKGDSRVFSSPPSNVEEVKKCMRTGSVHCRQSPSYGVSRSSVELLTPERQDEEEELWKNMETSCRQGVLESRLKKLEHCNDEFGSVERVFGQISRNCIGNDGDYPIDYRSTKNSQEVQQDRSSTVNPFGPTPAPHGTFLSTNVSREGSASHVTETFQNPRLWTRSKGSDKNDAFLVDRRCSGRRTSQIVRGRISQYGNDENFKQTTTTTTLRSKSSSPSLKSNVFSGNFGSLKSIRAYYKTMGTVKSAISRGNDNGEESDDGCPVTGTDAPIDLSKRFQKPERSLQSAEAVYDNHLTAGNSFSDTSRINNGVCVFKNCTHPTPSFDRRELNASPNTGLSVEYPVSSIVRETDSRLETPFTSLPSSRIGSPATIPERHLPPKKRRFQSYDFVVVPVAETESDDDRNHVICKIWDDSDRSPGDKEPKIHQIPMLEGVTDLEPIGNGEEQFKQNSYVLENPEDADWALIPDDDGDLPLHIAVARASESLVEKCVKIMSSHGTPVDIYNNKRKTALHLAVISQQPRIVDLLLRAAASPNVCDRVGDNSIHLAVKYRSFDCLKCLVTKSNHVIDLDARNYEGLTALHLSVLSDELEFAQILLRVGTSVNVADGKTGRMPLHCAAERDSEVMAKLLLAYGANPCTATYSGCTPAQMASARSHLEMAKMLEQCTYSLRSAVMPALTPVSHQRTVNVI